MMNAIRLLTRQHRRIRALLAEYLDAARHDHARRERALSDLADLVAIHATLEERLLYPAAHAVLRPGPLLEFAEKHLVVKRLLADALEADRDHPALDAKVHVAIDLLLRHAREDEERYLFPRLQRALGQAELEVLGQEMTAMAERLRSTGEPRDVVLLESDDAAPI